MDLITLTLTLAGLFVASQAGDDFDGIGIGLVHRPKNCDKTTKPGDLLRVEYNATLGDQYLFESSAQAGSPYEFILGEGQVIAGWEWGLRDMCVGEHRHLSVPSKWAYGDAGLGGRLPARATLYFNVRLLSFKSMPGQPKKSNIFGIVDTDNDGLLSLEEVETYVRKENLNEEAGPDGVKHLVKEIFEEEDRNKDGFIGHNEFNGRKHDEL